MTPKNELLVDDTRWPVLLVRSPPGATRAESWIEVIESAVERCQRDQAPFALVFDVRDAGDLPSGGRELITNYIKEHYDVLKKWMVCHAVIETAVLHRAAMTTIMWLVGSKMPFRVKTFAKPEDGFRWAEASLKTFTEAARTNLPTAKRGR